MFLWQSLLGSTFIELDPSKERLRQREGWYHWVTASQEGGGGGGGGGGDASVSSPTYPQPLAGGGVPPEYSVIGRPGESPLLSAAPSEASDAVVSIFFIMSRGSKSSCDELTYWSVFLSLGCADPTGVESELHT